MSGWQWESHVLFKVDVFKSIHKADVPGTLFLTRKRSLLTEIEKNLESCNLTELLSWTGSPGEVFSVSQGQRISSRCAAVKSVLGPKRLVTVEGSPAIRFLSVQRPVLERSHPALLRHQSPPPRLLLAPPQGSGRVLAPVGGRPWPLAAGARGPGAPGTAVSTSHGVSGDGGRRLRPYGFLSPGVS